MNLTTHSARKKFRTLDELVKITDELKNKGKIVVFTNGCFYLLHAAHIELLEKARNLGDILIVGLNSDSSLRKTRRYPKKIISEEERVQIISGIYCVDYLTLYDEPTPCEIIARLKPDIHVKGSDYNPDDYSNMPEAKIVREYGGKVEIIDTFKKCSTSEIITKIKHFRL